MPASLGQSAEVRAAVRVVVALEGVGVLSAGGHEACSSGEDCAAAIRAVLALGCLETPVGHFEVRMPASYPQLAVMGLESKECRGDTVPAPLDAVAEIRLAVRVVLAAITVLLLPALARYEETWYKRKHEVRGLAAQQACIWRNRRSRVSTPADPPGASPGAFLLLVKCSERVGAPAGPPGVAEAANAVAGIATALSVGPPPAWRRCAWCCFRT
jgi:hypothetical protein